MTSKMSGLWRTVTLLLVAPAAMAASVVESGYLSLRDGTRLNYTVTRPDQDGRYPVLLKYDPYDAGLYSDPNWNQAGYITLGVNMRGTGCSEGVFAPLRADQWGADGGEVVDWAAQQTWSSGAVGMTGYSFTGVSQLATAAFAGTALKAIAPGNVFTDFHRDFVYPGGIHNSWIAAWIGGGRQFVVGNAVVTERASNNPECALHLLLSQSQDSAHTADTISHPYDDAFWDQQPDSYLDRVRLPVLGCVNWQDTTIYSRAGLIFRDRLPSATTWLMGSNGSHSDCAISRARLTRFYDRYLKGLANDWESTPRLVLAHEMAGPAGANESIGGQAEALAGWVTEFDDWNAVAAATQPLALYLHAEGRLDLLKPAADETAETYLYPRPTANTPPDFAGISFWNNPRTSDGFVSYTTPVLAQDVEVLGSGSVDLWLSSTATDTDVQVTLMEARPDGQEMYVANGWLRASRRALDTAASTELRPRHTQQQADAAVLTPLQPVALRIELLPFNHVFREGSAIRLQIDAPGGYFQLHPEPAVNQLHHLAAMPSRLMLGWLPKGRAGAPLPSCANVLNQPCRASSAAIPPGRLQLASPDFSGPPPPDRLSPAPAVASPSTAVAGRFGGAVPGPVMLMFGLLGLYGFRRPRGRGFARDITVSSG